MDLSNYALYERSISRLYRGAAQLSLTDWPRWALMNLQAVLPFDGAFWGTGHVSTMRFHNQVTVGVPASLGQTLVKTIHKNPLYDHLLKRLGEPIDMKEIIPDEIFYKSSLYSNHLARYNIERILSSIHWDQRFGVFTLLTLYRFNRNNYFSQAEKVLYKRLLFHLLAAQNHSHTLFLERVAQQSPEWCYALCDQQGIYRLYQPGFRTLVKDALGQFDSAHTPFDLNLSEQSLFGVHADIYPIDDYILIAARPTGLLDRLSKRERQIVKQVSRGLSFKATAQELGLSTSTVSNHLYRAYQKLGINSRTELATLVAKQPELNLPAPTPPT